MAVLRKAWRQLTSMRTALVLLFLLAVAAIPGSLLPQRSLNIEKVGAYFTAHPALAPWLDRLSLFDVFSSPWFAAIYLLLFTSLVGCVVPRLKQHVQALVSRPPDAPRRLDRLPVSAAAVTLDGAPRPHADRVAGVLRRDRFRTQVRTHDDGTVTVAAEKGYLRETGNLLFHLALLVLLGGVAFGSWYGWHGNRLLIQGADQAFCDSLQQYDDYGLGARVQPADLPPFCVQLDRFTARYLANGQPVQFSADVTYSEADGAAHRRAVSVNAPLRLPQANVYLLGHGYAPVLKYTDRYGASQTSVAAFLPSDSTLTSTGVVLFPDANTDPKTGTRAPRQQVGFQGIYLPTVPPDPSVGHSLYPAERDPALMLVAYRGDLGLDAGIPRSVYTIDHQQIAAGRLKQVGQPHLLRPGQSWKLDDGSTVQFVGTRPWATISVRYDPGEPIVLAGAILLLVGLMPSLAIRRRRVFFRLRPTTEGTELTAGGLARNEYPGFAAEFDRLLAGARPDAPSEKELVP